MTMPPANQTLRIAYPLHMVAWGDSPGTGIGRYLFELAQALHTHRAELGVELLLVRGHKEPAPPFRRLPSSEFPSFRQMLHLPPRAQRTPTADAAPTGHSRDYPSRLERIQNRITFWAHARFIASQGVDLLHYGTHLGTPPAPRTLPTVITVHDLVPHLYSETITERIRYGWQEFLAAAPHAAHFLCVSAAVAQDLQTHLGLPRSAMTVTPHGVSPTYKPPKAPESDLAQLYSRYQIRPPYLLLVSTIEPRKNQEVAIRALLDLPSELTLVLAGGKGWKAEGLPQLITDLGLEERVHFPGFIADEDLPALYGCAEAFVFPSHYEGFGLPVIEAMACGTPVVCSHGGALPEVAGEAAILVDGADWKGMAAAVRRLRESADLRDRYRRAGLERAAMFTWKAAAKATVAGYRKALDRHTTRGG
jgi:glycosyltransferase involved in cell wall biosynthesis